MITTATLIAAAILWQDFNVSSINKVPGGMELMYYPTRQEALDTKFYESPNCLLLNGKWDFRYFDTYRQVPQAIDHWDTISVPGNWEPQGYGTAIYVNTHYEFAPLNPEPPKLPEINPTGVYHRTFNIPGSWQGRTVYLNMCGAKSGVHVYINGAFAGYNDNSKDLARYDITSLLREGSNDITLVITRYSTGSYLECQDFWRISGIERDIYLSSESTPGRISPTVISTLDSDLTTGILTIRSEAPVYFELLDNNDNTILSGDVNGTSRNTIPNVLPWSAETPNLYTLLVKADGEFTRIPIGFRRFEINGNLFLVNGQPVKFKGVNYHEHNEFTGHYTTREDILADILQMKANNINAIRTSHYPQPRYFYDLCDSLGMYVYSEANVESHGMGYAPDRTLGNNPKWIKRHIDRIMDMYDRVAGYPCVTILSLGNEGGNGVCFYEAYDYLKAIESKGYNRPVCYERAEFDRNTDMIVPQYPGADWFRRMGEEYTERPVCPSEYAHAMGNSTGDLDSQWEYIYGYPHLQGGFLWDWKDQGLREFDEDDNFYWAYGGDYGENTPSDNNFLCNGIVNPDGTPHPAMMQVKHVYQDISVSRTGKKTFNVFNRFYFKSLKGYTLRWTIVRDGKKVRKGGVKLSAGPQESETVKIRLPWWMRKKSEYLVNFETVSPDGDVVANDQLVLQEKLAPAKVWRAARASKVVDDSTVVKLTAGKATLIFDKATGIVKSYRVNGKEMWDHDFGLRPNFWRAPTDNDYGNGQPRRAAAWRDAVRGVDIDVDGAVVKVTYHTPGGSRFTAEYSLVDKGALRVVTKFEGGDEHIDIPRIGFRMRLSATSDGFCYYGRIGENYWDRKSGYPVGLWNSRAGDEYFPYVRPQECGHHTDVAWLEIGKFTAVADSTLEFNALHMAVEDLDCANNTDRPFQWPNYSPDEVHDETAAEGVLRRQTHINDVPHRDYVELCLDYRMSGVGGYDSWGARPEVRHTIWSDMDYSWAFTIVPKK